MSTISSYSVQRSELDFTYNLVDADEVFADDAGHLAHDYGVAFIRDLFNQGGEELSLYGQMKQRLGISNSTEHNLDVFGQIAAQI